MSGRGRRIEFDSREGEAVLAAVRDHAKAAANLWDAHPTPAADPDTTPDEREGADRG